MAQTYKATGINLQGKAFGDNDRLLTILTPEYGLISAIAPGARKYKSSLRGRSELFVVNDLLLIKGRSLDKIIQAESQESYPKLSKNLGKLTISQYLAELTFYLALKDQPQLELYNLLTENLKQIETLSNNNLLLPYLTQAIFQILIISGIAPEVNYCCLTRKRLIPNFKDPNFKVGFSFNAGGFILLSEIKSNQHLINNKLSDYYINNRLDALELSLFQHSSNQTLSDQFNNINHSLLDNTWLKIERILTNYIEFYLGNNIKSAQMLNIVNN